MIVQEHETSLGYLRSPSPLVGLTINPGISSSLSCPSIGHVTKSPVNVNVLVIMWTMWRSSTEGNNSTGRLSVFGRTMRYHESTYCHIWFLLRTWCKIHHRLQKSQSWIWKWNTTIMVNYKGLIAKYFYWVNLVSGEAAIPKRCILYVQCIWWWGNILW